MSTAIKEMQAKIDLRHQEALAKRAGVALQPEVVGLIRANYRAGVSISVIQGVLKEMRISISLNKVSKIARSRNPKKNGGVSGVVGGMSATEAAPGRGGAPEYFKPGHSAAAE